MDGDCGRTTGRRGDEATTQRRVVRRRDRVVASSRRQRRGDAAMRRRNDATARRCDDAMMQRRDATMEFGGTVELCTKARGQLEPALSLRLVWSWAAAHRLSATNGPAPTLTQKKKGRPAVRTVNPPRVWGHTNVGPIDDHLWGAVNSDSKDMQGFDIN